MTEILADGADDDAGAPAHGDDVSRRDFIFLAAGAMGAVGAACVAWPLINSMNPAADALALASIEVDISALEVGQAMTVTWRGKPVFIRRRSEEEIDAARTVDLATLREPQADDDRVKADRPDILVLVGICTHLGCVPQGQKPNDARGDFGGWLCPCHYSHYDTSGRIRLGPAPGNLPVPEWAFSSDSVIKIG